jgi:cell division protein FtsB
MTKKELATLKAETVKDGIKQQVQTYCATLSKIRYYQAENATLSPKVEAEKQKLEQNNADLKAHEKGLATSEIYINVLNAMLEEFEKDSK